MIKKIGVLIDTTISKDTNINGPCLIKVPDFILNKLGNYYLYFAHHHGKYIRMAYSDNICGPYNIFNGGVLSLDSNNGFDHVASPHVIIKNNKLILYYHSFDKNKKNQITYQAESIDGINFLSTNDIISYPYFSCFDYKKKIYGIAMKMKMKSNQIIYNYDTDNNKFIEFCNLLPDTRHCFIKEINNKLYAFYSIVGDCPEHICYCEIICDGNNFIALINNNKSLIYPELEYEHGNMLPIKSKYGAEYKTINQLRDPYIYIENDIVYILYTICGEQGIAIAIIHNQAFS